MKKLFILTAILISSLVVFGQNEYKYVLNLYGGLKIGSEARIASVAEVDSIKIVSGELLFYVGSTPYYAGTASSVSIEDTISPVYYYRFGSGLAGDTVYADASLNAVCGHYYVANDSLQLTNLITNISSGDTLDFSLVYNDSVYVSTDCDTIVTVNAGSAAGKINTTLTTSVPYGNYIWIEIDAVVTGSKPIWFRSDLIGYIKRD